MQNKSVKLNVFMSFNLNVKTEQKSLHTKSGLH